MKKRLVVLLSIIMLLNGCGLSNEQYNDTDKELEEQIKIEEDSSFHTTFFFIDNKIFFPESTVKIIVKEIAGRDKEVIQDNRREIIDLINHIENVEILSEAETMNPDAQLLGIHFSVILLTVDSEYILINFRVFDDDRICMDAISEKSENNINIWIKSSEIAKGIKDLVGYKELDSIQLDPIEKVELSDDQGSIYQFTENETKQMEDILKHAKIKPGDYKCPYDINVLFDINGEKVYAKFCNDSCRLLAIEGFYFELEEQDANWILDIAGNLTK